MTSISQDELVRTLLAQRARINAGVWLVVRDVHITEDVFQEVMIRALENQRQFRDEVQLLAWCRVTARNTALNLLRKRRQETTMLSTHVLDLLDREWAVEDAAPAARIEALQDCLETLPERSRVLLDLRYFQGRTCAEVGKLLGLSLDAAYQRLSRLHRAMRACVEQRVGNSLPSKEQTQ